VIKVSKVEILNEKIEQLSIEERRELITKLFESMSTSDLRLLFEIIKDNEELMSMLKVSESTFDDWLNEEDSIYDTL